MDFEIISDVTQAETIAVGSSIREISRLRRRFGPGLGESGKVLPEYDFQMAQFVWRSYIGMKLTASDELSTKSKDISTEYDEIIKEDVRHLPAEHRFRGFF